jgi:hypothetical protein
MFFMRFDKVSKKMSGEVLRFLSSNDVCVEDTELDSFLNDVVANEGYLIKRTQCDDTLLK